MRSRLATTGAIVLVASLVAFAGFVAAFYAQGGRWFDITTPSMAQAAPVGTLVITQPTEAEDLRVGQIISFTPPVLGDTVYTHRITKIDANGIHTKGDLNGADDGWTVSPDNVIGVVTHRIWGGGWLLRAAPLLAAGWFMVWGLSLAWRRYEWQIKLLGGSIVVSLVGLWLRPWIAFQLVTFAPNGQDSNGIRASVVSTGILPVRVTAFGGTHTDLIAGQLGVVETAVLDPSGRFRMVPSIHMGFWWWVAAIAFCLTPTVIALAIGRREELPTSDPDELAETEAAALAAAVVGDPYFPRQRDGADDSPVNNAASAAGSSASAPPAQGGRERAGAL